MLDNVRAMVEGEELPHGSVLTYEVWYWAAEVEDRDDRWFGG